MNAKQQAVLENAKEFLKNVDPDEFLDTFLELQENATGPTCDEFIASFNLPENTQNKQE